MKQRRTSKCKYCGIIIMFTISKNNTWVPVELISLDGGDWVYDGKPLEFWPEIHFIHECEDDINDFNNIDISYLITL